MHIATHLINVKGTFDRNIWTMESLKRYVNKKIKSNIFETFHTDIESFNVTKNNIDVSVYISCLPSEVKKSIVSKWLKENIIENGIRVTWFNIEEINCFFEPNKFSLLLEWDRNG